MIQYVHVLRKNTLLCTTILILVIHTNCFAGEDHFFGQFDTIFLNGKFRKDSPWLWYGEASLRSAEYPKSFNRSGYDIGSVVARVGFGYQIDQMNSIMVGYAYQYSQPPLAKKDVNENRAWQQYLNVLDFKENGKLQNRIRFEQRELEGGYGTALRFRHQLKYSYPLDKDWGFVVSNEVFINCNTVGWGPVAGFDQNRFFIGPLYQFTPDIRAEVGYQNVFINKDLVDDLMIHGVNMSLYINVPN